MAAGDVEQAPPTLARTSQDPTAAVAHSRISGRGIRRSRAVPNNKTISGSLKPSVPLVLQSRVACWPIAQAHALMYPIARMGHQRASKTHGMQATPTAWGPLGASTTIVPREHHGPPRPPLCTSPHPLRALNKRFQILVYSIVVSKFC